MISTNYIDDKINKPALRITDLHAPVNYSAVTVKDVESILRSTYGLTIQGRSKKLDSYWDYNFRIITNQGPLFCKVYTHDSHEDALFHSDIIGKLHSEGLPTARIFSTSSGSVVSSLNGLAMIVQNFLPGKSLSELLLDEQKVRIMGQTLAQIHNILEVRLFCGNQTKVSSWDPRQHALLFTRYEAGLNKFSASERRNLNYLQKQTEKLYSDFAGLPIGVIHGDFHPGNILFNHGKISGILDFNEAIKSWHIADIGIALNYIASASEDGLKVASDFVRSYRKERAISREELEVLPLMIQLRAATKVIESRLLDGSKSPEEIEIIEFFNNEGNFQSWCQQLKTS